MSITQIEIPEEMIQKVRDAKELIIAFEREIQRAERANIPGTNEMRVRLSKIKKQREGILSEFGNR